eukprot:977400-Prymnesium_polylepis.1
MVMPSMQCTQRKCRLKNARAERRCPQVENAEHVHVQTRRASASGLRIPKGVTTVSELSSTNQAYLKNH